MSELIITGATLTMSSREIAELVDSRHDKVKQSIERLAARGVISLPPLGEYLDSLGRTASEYRVGKRDSYVIVAQLSPEFTARLVDRWQELESGAATLPKTLPEALRLAADEAEKREKAETALAIAAPKAEALDQISASDEAVTITQAAKILGIKRETLTNWLHANGWVYRQNESWVAYEQHIRNGHLQYKEARYTDEKTLQQCVRPYCHIMPKGLALLATMFIGGKAA